MELHPKFTFNGIGGPNVDWAELAYSLIKEGEAFERSIGNFLLDWFDASSTVTVTTSGSTGTPKQIRLKKESMCNSALATGAYFGFQAGDRTLLCLSADYIAGKMLLARAMVLGLHLDAVEPSSNPMDAIDGNYKFVPMVPLQVEHSLDHLNRVELLLVGGAPMSQTLKEKLQHVQAKVYGSYGMTETITHIAVSKINNLSKNYRSEVYNALPDVLVDVDDRGCLVINAPKIVDTPIITNDLVKLHSNTAFEWLGRWDNVINSGGIKLIPEKIEVKLSKVLNNRFFITSNPDEKLGQKLVLVIEGDCQIDQLQKAMANLQDLEKYERPKEILCVPKFLETASGKVLRQLPEA